MASSNTIFHNSTVLFLAIVSLFGLFIILALTLTPPVSGDNFVWRKPMIGVIFASVCVFGTLAVFLPNQCSKVFNFRKGEKRGSRFYGFKHSLSISEGGSLALRGHHPLCGRFISHVFHVGGRIFCATCSGLFFGALVVLMGVVAYFFGNWQIEQNIFAVVCVGMIGVILGLLQAPLFAINRSIIRIFSSAFLAIGSFLILVGIDELVADVFLDVFLVFLTVFWLMTRISLSQWEHERICSICTSADCAFAERTKKQEF